MIVPIFFIFVLIGVGVYLWLRAREDKRAEKGQTRLSNLRLILASIFAMIALFSGGCSLLFIPESIKGNQYVDPVAVLIVGGIPFALASLFLWLCLKRGNS